MKPNKQSAVCLLVIIGLVLAQGGVLLAAGVGSDELVRQLRSDIDLLLGISGAIARFRGCCWECSSRSASTVWRGHSPLALTNLRRRGRGEPIGPSGTVPAAGLAMLSSAGMKEASW